MTKSEVLARVYEDLKAPANCLKLAEFYGEEILEDEVIDVQEFIRMFGMLLEYYTLVNMGCFPESVKHFGTMHLWDIDDMISTMFKFVEMFHPMGIRETQWRVQISNDYEAINAGETVIATNEF